jgi:hypothetical protein
VLVSSSAALLLTGARVLAAGQPALALDFDGYLEAYYSYNFNRPASRTTRLRAFDSSVQSFSLSIVALGLTAKAGPVTTRLVLQYGPTPLSYYAPEDQAFVPVQEGYAAWMSHPGFVHEAGLFLSPLGLEALAPKDEWNWSRSFIWTALPGYHLGVRSTYAISDTVDVQVGAFNGWNAAIDNNEQKSVAVRISARPTDGFKATLLYFGGVERSTGSPEGRPWRHTFDGAIELGPWHAIAGRLYSDCGVEGNRFGRSGWASGAVYVRYQLPVPVFVAARAEVLREWVAESSTGRAKPIFWGTPAIGSATLTADYRPGEHVSVQLEYRSDRAATDLFYRRNEGASALPSEDRSPTARSQQTLTAGVTTWF